MIVLQAMMELILTSVCPKVLPQEIHSDNSLEADHFLISKS